MYLRLKKMFCDRGNTLAAAWSFNQLAYAIIYPFIPIYLSAERGIPYSTVGWIFPLLGIAVCCAPIPCGWMTDRWGRSFMMLFGQYSRGVLFFILAVMVFFNAPFWLFCVILMLNTAVGTAFQVGSDAYLSDITTEKERPVYYSKIRVGFNLGWALGPAIGAFFAQTPFWLFFVATGLLCIAGGLFTGYACCRNAGKVLPATPQRPRKKQSFLPLLLTNRNLLLILCGVLLLTSLVSQLYSTMSVYSTMRIGISKESLGSIYSLNGFIVLFLQIPVTALVEKTRFSLKTKLLAGVLFYAAGFGLLGFAVNAVHVAIFVTILTFGEILIHPALYAVISNQAVPENAGKIMAANALARGIGYAVGPWFGAQLFEKTPSNIILWGVLSSFAIASAAVFYLAKTAAPDPETKQQNLQ